MNLDIGLILGVDGITNGALYALMALALILVFTVTRVILIPQGDFIVYAALTLASLQAGRLPGTLYVLLALSALSVLISLYRGWRQPQGVAWWPLLGSYLLYPGLLAAACLWWLQPGRHLWLDVLLTLMIVVPLGPALYRVAFQPMANASVLTLLIAAIAVHYSMVGISLICFGPEGFRTVAFSDQVFALGSLQLPSQSLWVLLTSGVLILALYVFFGHSLYGKALKATAFNRTGARLVGISPEQAGRTSFLLASLIGSLSGVLMAPLTTLYYDSGFLIGLKGFVGAILGGLASYPLAALGALFVGLLEAASAFYASAFKEVIVFTLIIPVLFWLSLKAGQRGGDE